MGEVRWNFEEVVVCSGLFRRPRTRTHHKEFRKQRIKTPDIDIDIDIDMDIVIDTDDDIDIVLDIVINIGFIVVFDSVLGLYPLTKIQKKEKKEMKKTELKKSKKENKKKWKST